MVRARSPDQMELMHFGELIAETSTAVRVSVHAQLIELFSKHETPAGIVMPAKAFLVPARVRTASIAARHVVWD